MRRSWRWVWMAVLAAAPAAQRTWVVDADNGPGTDFTDLPAAFAAVADGDHVLVRAGVYRPGELRRAIRLRAEAGAEVHLGSVERTLRVTGLPAWRDCVLDGLVVLDPAPSGRPGGIKVDACPGPVLLRAVRVANGSAGPGVHVVDCGAVAIVDAEVRSHLLVDRSTVAALRCVFRAYPNGPITAGVFAYGSTVELTDCSATGSDGGGILPPAWAVRAWSSRLVLRGDDASRYVGGRSGANAAPSLEGAGTSGLVVDPRVVLDPPPANFASVAVRTLAALDARESPGAVDVTLRSPPDQPYALVLGLPVPAFAAPWGTLWLDPRAALPVAAGRQGPTGELALRLAHSGAPELVGRALLLQAATVPAGSELTNPAPAVLR